MLENVFFSNFLALQKKKKKSLKYLVFVSADIEIIQEGNTQQLC